MKNRSLKTKTIILVVLGFASNVQLKGQSSCDNLYAKAVQCQQTMTIASQNQAITYFQKAQTCYDSEDKKNLCSSQIKTCKNTISVIKKNAQGGNKESKKKKPEDEKDELTLDEMPERVMEDTAAIALSLSVSESVVKFKGKGGEFKKVKVNCNANDWSVEGMPDWISYSINSDNEIVLEALENNSKEERSCIIKVKCRGLSVTFGVLQSKKGWFGG